MNKIEIEKKLKAINGNSNYIRVSDNHPLELYIGKNEDGKPTLRYNGVFNFVKINGSRDIEIKQFEIDNKNSILFSCTSNNSIDTFVYFCISIISETQKCNNNDDGYKEILKCYNMWKKMFSNNTKILSENEILGLIGELTFLKDVAFKKYGFEKALKGWSGPEPTHKDFSFDNEWFELKAINDSRKTVKISSLEQLDSKTQGYLIVYRFEKMSESFHGVKLNDLIKVIYEMLDEEYLKDLFLDKMKLIGYFPNQDYDKSVYNLISCEKYTVNDDFPRLKSCNLPNEISNVQYELILSMIRKFKE